MYKTKDKSKKIKVMYYTLYLIGDVSKAEVEASRLRREV